MCLGTPAVGVGGALMYISAVYVAFGARYAVFGRGLMYISAKYVCIGGGLMYISARYIVFGGILMNIGARYIVFGGILMNIGEVYVVFGAKYVWGGAMSAECLHVRGATI